MKNKGFTLLELLIVVAIVSLLISITISFIGDSKKKGKDTEKIQTILETRKALQLYATDKGGFPNSLSKLVDNNYISSIDSNIIYSPTNNVGIICTETLCPSYHMAIPLVYKNNPALKSDSDKITINSINGRTSNCLNDGEMIDMCFDVTP